MCEPCLTKMSRTSASGFFSCTVSNTHKSLFLLVFSPEVKTTLKF